MYDLWLFDSAGNFAEIAYATLLYLVNSSRAGADNNFLLGEEVASLW